MKHNNNCTNSKKDVPNNNIAYTENQINFPPAQTLSIHPPKANSNHNIINISSTKTKSDLSELDKLTIKRLLNTHFLFKDKGQEVISKITENIMLKKYEINTEIKTQDLFYIIKEGKVEIFTGKSTPKIMFSEETFGELALIEKRKQSIKLKFLEDSTVYILKGEVFRNIVQKINESELKERLMFISFVPIFKYLNQIQLQSVANSMYKCEFNINQRIINEGDTGESLFIIKSGNVACSKKEEVIRHLTSKDFFGENALLFHEKRSLTIYATNKTICYQISKGMLIECLGKEYHNTILKSITKEALKASRYLRLFECEYFFSKFYSHSKILHIQTGETLIHIGDEPQYLYVIITGDFYKAQKSEINIHNNDINIEQTTQQANSPIQSSFISQENIFARRGELFGDVNIKANKPYDYNIKSRGESKIISFNWNEIINEFNIKLERRKIISFFTNLYHLKNIDIFKEASDSRLIEICKIMKKEKFQPNETIFKERDSGDKLYLIKKGIVDVYKNDKFIRQLCTGNCFGELSLLVNEPRSATIISSSTTTLYTLTQENFLSCVDKNMLNYLSKKIALQDNFNITLNDLFFCKSLGRGKFGQVTLVHNNKNFYAIKAVKRKEAEKQKILIKYFIQERNILLKLDHPFIMKLVRTFKNEENIFYMMEYINGVVLSKYIESRDAKTIKNVYETQFFMSFIFIVLEYLNNRKICHRDLKPDNIMVDEKGFIKIIDFGTSVEIENFTSTITGTPHYIAPEVLIGKGYNFSCDYWSAGIIAHEIYYNFYPFGNKAIDPMDVYREVIKKELKLPKNGNVNVNDFIKKLLKKKVSDRICSLEKVKECDLYTDYNWDEIIELKAKVPYTPQTTALKQMSSYMLKYMEYLQKQNNEDNKKTLLKKDSIDNNDENDHSAIPNGYDPNWAEVF